MSELLRQDFGQLWSDLGERLEPASEKQTQGWVQEMMPYQWQNWLQYRTDYAASYLLQKGIPEWSENQEYIANKSFVQHNGHIYIATTTQTGAPIGSTAFKQLTVTTDASGHIPITSGGTGANNAAQARINLGLGTAAELDESNVVQYDANQNFSANIISAALNGNAATATKLLNARTIAISGGATSTATAFDGTANISINVTALDGTKISGVIPVESLINAVIKTSETGSATLPRGPASARDASPQSGYLRFNEDVKLIEFFNGTTWITPNGTDLGGLVGDGDLQFSNNGMLREGYVQQTSPTGAAKMPTGPTADRPEDSAAGDLRFNEDVNRFEGYNGSAWGSLGGASGAGGDSVFYENDSAITTSFVITKNAMTTGPIEILEGTEIEIVEGKNWVIL